MYASKEVNCNKSNDKSWFEDDGDDMERDSQYGRRDGHGDDGN